MIRRRPTPLRGVEMLFRHVVELQVAVCTPCCSCRHWRRFVSKIFQNDASPKQNSDVCDCAHLLCQLALIETRARERESQSQEGCAEETRQRRRGVQKKTCRIRSPLPSSRAATSICRFITITITTNHYHNHDSDHYHYQSLSLSLSLPITITVTIITNHNHFHCHYQSQSLSLSLPITITITIITTLPVTMTGHSRAATGACLCRLKSTAFDQQSHQKRPFLTYPSHQERRKIEFTQSAQCPAEPDKTRTHPYTISCPPPPPFPLNAPCRQRGESRNPNEQQYLFGSEMTKSKCPCFRSRGRSRRLATAPGRRSCATWL